MSFGPLSIALIDPARLVSADDATAVAAVVTKQLQNHLAPAWNVTGSVHYFSDPHSVPNGYALLQLVESAGDDSDYGFHTLAGNRPVAYVQVEEGSNLWSLTVSHEALEMTVDPTGSTLIAGSSPDGQRHVQYLAEICDPCQSPDVGYSIDGYLVSEFVLKNYYGPASTPGPYSVNGRITAPRSLLPDGYLSWMDPTQANQWFKKAMDSDGVPSTSRIGSPPTGMALRSWVDRATMRSRLAPKLPQDLLERLDRHRKRVLEAGRASVEESIVFWKKRSARKSTARRPKKSS